MSISAIGLLLLRLVVGLVMMGHGAQKALGWFGGPGWTSFTEALRHQGLKPGWLWALLAGASEGMGWLLIALGLLDAFLRVRNGNPLRAFVLSMLAISLLSLGLSLSVQPLSRLLAPRAERETLEPLPQEGAEPIQ